MVHVCEGIGLADGVPITEFHSAFPAASLPGLPEALRDTGSITAALERCGVADYVRVSTTISAHCASSVQAHLLRIAEGAPLLRTVSINATADGRPIELGQTWFAGERVQFTYGE